MSARTGPRAQARPQSQLIAELRGELEQLARLCHESIMELGKRNDNLITRVAKLEEALEKARGKKAEGNGHLIIRPGDN